MSAQGAPAPARPRRVLVTGATGYVGGRLLPVLERRSDLALRCLARRPEFLRPRVAASTEVVQGDVCDPASLRAALRGVDAAFYLVHAMGGGHDFADEERRGARAFAEAARDCGLRRIVYLGGLGAGPGLSPHLRSRREVGEILRRSGVATLELRASIIIGSGSLSFEIVRALVDRLPVLVTPRWTRVRTQPIAVEDVVAYLEAALDLPDGASEVIEIGGADVVSYGDLMREYARQVGLRRLLLPVPVLTPRLSSLWLGLVTPVYRRIGRHLIEGLRNPTLVQDSRAGERFPGVRPRGVAEAIARALRLEDEAIARTRWFDALGSGGPARAWGGVRFGRRLVDARRTHVSAPPEVAFRAVERIGGARGWYGAGALWRLRGALDLAVGGVGMRRGRPDPEHLRPGDAVDFWRVDAIEPGRMLRLAAEMKLPGRAWLQFEVEPEAGGAAIAQTAVFDPVGLGGPLYWYALYPVHAHVFASMLRGLASAAEREAGPEAVRPPCPPAAPPPAPR
jgi:uncharacterized protein YbjT (DUF2867 family)